VRKELNQIGKKINKSVDIIEKISEFIELKLEGITQDINN